MAYNSRNSTDNDIFEVRRQIEEVAKIPGLVCVSESIFEDEPLDDFQILPAFTISVEIKN